MNLPVVEAVFDTSLVSHDIQGVPRAVELMGEVRSRRLVAGISSMSSYEFWPQNR